MSTRSHERLEELIAADALGGLDDSDRRAMLAEMAEHGPDCVECATLMAEYGEVAARLATSLDPAPMSPGAEERLLAAARATEAPGPSVGRDPAAAATGRRPRWIALVAAAAVVAVIAGAVGYAIAPKPDAQRQAFAAFVADPSTRVVPLEGAPGQKLAVALRPGDTQAWVVGDELPDPSGGQVYELWFREAGTETMQPGGTFVPDHGAVLSPATVGQDVDLLAVTVEPAGGSDAPTSDPIFVSSA
jgi:anti-sigma-K factor RskA